MKNAFIDVFSGVSDSAILVGSDIPDLTGDTFEDAFRGLNDHDAVLGPSHDGGYYLIGFNRNRFAPSIFKCIEWGTSEVFRQTIDELVRMGCHSYILPEHRDIDTCDDLIAFYHNHIDDEFVGSTTMKCLLSKVPDFLQNWDKKTATGRGQ